MFLVKWLGGLRPPRRIICHTTSVCRSIRLSVCPSVRLLVPYPSLTQKRKAIHSSNSKKRLPTSEVTGRAIFRSKCQKVNEGRKEGAGPIVCIFYQYRNTRYKRQYYFIIKQNLENMAGLSTFGPVPNPLPTQNSLSDLRGGVLTLTDPRMAEKKGVIT